MNWKNNVNEFYEQLENADLDSTSKELVRSLIQSIEEKHSS